MADITENMVADISIPEAKTMQTHLASANPHPQYLIKTSLGVAASAQIRLGDLNDVLIAGDQLTGKVLALSGAIWKPMDVNELVEQAEIPIADTSTYGKVRLATNEDVLLGNIVAVTPATMSTFVSNYMIDNKAGSSTFGTVKLVSTGSDLANAITHGETNYMVEQVDFNRYTCITTSDHTIYSTTADPVSNTEYDSISGIQYIAYRDGVISNHINDTNINGYVVVSSGGNAYDVSTCGHVIINHDGSIKRLNVIPLAAIAAGTHYINDANDTTYIDTTGTRTYETMQGSALAEMMELCAWTDISGTAHGLHCAPSGWIAAHNVEGAFNGSTYSAAVVTYAKCGINVADHGHLEYATIEGTGLLQCHNTGIIEHIIVRNTQSDNLQQNHYGLVITPGGSGFDITLQGSDAIVDGVLSRAYARASIQGYAEDVRVYSGCHLDMSYETAHAKNVTVYNGGYLTMNSSASIEGLVLYPGATIMKQDDCNIFAVANCHEPDKPVRQVYAVSTIIMTSAGHVTGQQQYYQYEQGGENSAVDYKDALLFTSAWYKIIKDGADTTYQETEGRIMMFSTDTPQFLRRTDVEMLTSAINATDGATYASCMAMAYKCYPAEVIACDKDASGLAPACYTITTPEHMYEEIHNTPDKIKWQVMF